MVLNQLFYSIDKVITLCHVVTMHRFQRWLCMAREIGALQWTHCDRCRTAKFSWWRMPVMLATWMTTRNGTGFFSISFGPHQCLETELFLLAVLRVESEIW